MEEYLAALSPKERREYYFQEELLGLLQDIKQALMELLRERKG